MQIKKFTLILYEVNNIFFVKIKLAGIIKIKKK